MPECMVYVTKTPSGAIATVIMLFDKTCRHAADGGISAAQEHPTEQSFAFTLFFHSTAYSSNLCCLIGVYLEREKGRERFGKYSPCS